MTDEYPSILLSNAVDQMASLPGVGRKTALRLVLSLLRRDEQSVEAFAGSFINLKKEIHYCKQCHNISDRDLCPICSSARRDRQLICVVENIRDVMSIEQTGQYNGLYHVLGGIISPLDGIGPKDIEADSLVNRIAEEDIREVILALPTTMEGDTTTFYLHRRLMSVGDNAEKLKISQLARGVAIGNDLEFTDELTLGRSIINRTEYTG